MNLMTLAYQKNNEVFINEALRIGNKNMVFLCWERSKSPNAKGERFNKATVII